MSIVRTIECNVCETSITEGISGVGWTGWGNLQGRQTPDGDTDCHLCPECLGKVFGFIDNITVRR